MADFVTFKDLGLSDGVLKAIQDKGFEEPTSIQSLTIPLMLGGKRDIIAQARTGTGKTAAFGLPLLELVDDRSEKVQALILVPTRELAVQVSEEINSLRGGKELRIVPIYGGQSIDEQLRRLRKGVHIVVGTPGRVIDHLKRGTLKLGNIRYLVLDEADEMLNMGFIDDITEIIEHTPETRRTLLFSATMPQRIRELAAGYMRDHATVSEKKDVLSVPLTEQIYFEVRPQDKLEALCRIIDIEENFYGLIFCRTKSDVDYLALHLGDRGYDVDALHGDFSQHQREKTLDKFKRKRINILVATDVAARGIDVINLSHVINYSLPQDPESYIHRIGRTGRAGNEGTAVTFITPSEYKQLMFIQRIAKADIRRSKIPAVSDIIQAKKKKIVEEISAMCEQGSDEHYGTWARDLLDGRDAQKVLTAVLSYAFREDLDPANYGRISESFTPQKSMDLQGKARLFVALGKKDRMDPSKMIQMIVERVPVPVKLIGDIQIMETFSFITVPFDVAENIVRAFREKGRKPLFTHARKPERTGRRK